MPGLVADVRVVHGPFVLEVAVRAAPGEVTAVLGPNGAGKSTLLRALAGLVPVEGRVVLDGRVLDDGDTHVATPDRRVGLVFQEHRLLPHLSARDNIAFGPRAQGSSRSSARAEADRWLGTVGLADQADARPGSLSGGQAQRVALARTLAASPALLLLDEPLAALDATTRADTRAWLRPHLQSFSGPSLVVTHDPVDAMTLADRLVVLEDGRVVQEGTPLDVARRPATRWVGRLVGLTVVHGTCREGVLVTDGGAVLRVADALTGPATAALRPSAVTLHPEQPGPSSSRNAWEVVLTGLEPYGDRVRASLDGPLPLLADVTLAAVAELRLTPGDRLWASAKATDVEVYPR